MTAPMTENPLRGTTQPDRVRSQNMKDQFGRLWLVDIDLKTGGRVGMPHPAGWADPLNTPPQYLQLSDNNTKVFVDYARWSRELAQAEREWHQKYQELGYARYGEKFDEVVGPTPMMAREVGPRPLSHQLPLRAMNGEEALLGHAPEVSERQRLQQAEDQLAQLRAEHESLLARMSGEQHEATTDTDEGHVA